MVADSVGYALDVGESKLVRDDRTPARCPKFDRHIAITVPDIEQTASELMSMGVEFARGNGRGGAAQLFVRDPDGNMIELR